MSKKCSNFAAKIEISIKVNDYPYTVQELRDSVEKSSMMKKILLLISFLLFVNLLYAETIVFVDGFYFDLDKRSHTATITYPGTYLEWAYNRKDEIYKGEMVIPSTIIYKKNKYTVSGIGDYAFYNCYLLTSITLPNTITHIDKYAFGSCENLITIDIPNSVTKIHSGAFSYSNLTSIIIPESVTEIGDWAFAYNTKLKSVTINCERVNIQSDAFIYCSNATVFYVPSNSLLRFQHMLSIDKSHIVAKNAPKPVTQPSVSVRPTYIQDNIDTNIPTSATNNNRTFAVIIGNENYQMVAGVPYADNDAKIFAQYCQKTLGLPAHNVRLYTDVTYGKMRSAIKDIKAISEAYKGDISVIFYYAGHGVPNESSKDAFLLPVDADGTDTEVCMPLSYLYKELASLQANNVVVLLDACFSGSQRGEGMLASARGIAIKARPIAPQGNMIVLSAATGDETAYPYKEKGHGLFTYYLLKKLQETSGNVTLQELGDYITTHVKQQSIVVNRKSQTPTTTAASEIGDSWKGWKLK